MSMIHILDQSVDLKTVNVIFHISIPSTNNSAGVSYQTALVSHLGGANAINSTVADATELTALKAGSVVEIKKEIRFSKLGLTPAQKLAEVRAAYTAQSASLLTEWQSRLDFYNYKADV